ncbi:MAG: glycosyltransferase [Actinobacteria bacterium]|nr:glycosyltransferase [Actinomycetota bacterium]
MDSFLLYQYVITGVLTIIFANFLVNNFLFKDISRFTIPDSLKSSLPLISILIPARNEAKNIGKCIKSLLKQSYPNIEILVLNDNSTDNTAVVVNKIAEKNSKVRLINGAPLPHGWLGKSYACYQLSKHAKGEYLIFTDADTFHFRDSISNAISCLIRNNLDALSAYPLQIMVSIHERILVSFINFFILGFLPLALVKNSRSPFFCTAIGQFMMFKKDVYQKIGGHKSVRNKVLEDVHISKQVKRHGYKFMIFDARKNIYCRMYKNFEDLIYGFSRFIFAAFNYNATVQFTITILFSAVFLFPFILLPLGLFVFDWSPLITNLITIQIFIILLIRLMLSIRFKGKVFDALLHPLSMLYIIVISINSVLQSKLKHGIYWKGRIYDASDGKNLKLLDSDYPDETEDVTFGEIKSS